MPTGAIVLLIVAVVLAVLLWLVRGRTAADEDQPNQASAEALAGLRYAGFLSRAVALVIDYSIVGLFFWSLQSGSVGFSVAASLSSYLLCAAVVTGYPVYFHARWGQTVGKMIAKVKVTQIDGAPVALRHAFLRSSVDIALSAIWAVSLIYVLTTWNGPDWSSLGFLDRGRAIAERFPISRWYDLVSLVWVGSELVVLLTNKKRRALHDFIAGTVVVQMKSLPVSLAAQDLRFPASRYGAFGAVERKTIALAVFLAFLVLFLYQRFFVVPR